DDDLRISQYGGLVGVGGGLTVQYDGGPGHDTLHIEGYFFIKQKTAYDIGATVDSGSFAMANAFRSLTVNFTHLSAVYDSFSASTLTVNLDDRNNFLKVGKEYATVPSSTYPIKLQGIDLQGEHDLLNGLFDGKSADSELTSGL